MSSRCSARGASGTMRTSNPSRRRSANTVTSRCTSSGRISRSLRRISVPPVRPSRRSASLRDLQALGDPRAGPEAIPRVRWEEARRRRAEEPQQRLELASRRARREQLVGDVREHDEPRALVRAHELADGRLEAALEHAGGEIEHDDAARARGDERRMADVVLACHEDRRAEQEREPCGEDGTQDRRAPAGLAQSPRLARRDGRAAAQAEGAWPSLISATSPVISSVAGDGGDQPCARARLAARRPPPRRARTPAPRAPRAARPRTDAGSPTRRARARVPAATARGLAPSAARGAPGSAARGRSPAARAARRASASSATPSTVGEMR